MSVHLLCFTFCGGMCVNLYLIHFVLGHAFSFALKMFVTLCFGACVFVCLFVYFDLGHVHSFPSLLILGGMFVHLFWGACVHLLSHPCFHTGNKHPSLPPPTKHTQTCAHTQTHVCACEPTHTHTHTVHLYFWSPP